MGEKRRRSGCVYLAQPKIPSFSYHRFSKGWEDLSMAECDVLRKRADSITNGDRRKRHSIMAKKLVENI
jgi:hypothetical protein